MGTTQSQEKSSLLKNFQYMIHHDGSGRKPLYKLLYFDYLNFLHYELDNEAWGWKIYEDIVKKSVGVGGGGSPTNEQLFCGWKQIQKQIFEKLKDQLTGSNTYNWDKDVLPLINIEEKKVLGATQDCKKLNVKIKDNIDEIKNAEFPAISGKSGPKCQGLTTSKDIHVPLRRRGLLVSYIYDYLNDIKDQFTTETTDQSKLKTVLGKKQTNIKVGSTNKNFNLTKDLVEGIAQDISKLIKQKHSTDDKAFCNEWTRTMDDYDTLLQGKDIVDDKETNDLQCLIKRIEQKVGGEKKFRDVWIPYFRGIVKDLHTKDFAKPTTGTPCTVDPSNKTQCVRFFEEWAEEFCKLKKELGQMVVTECGKTPSGTPGSSDCQGLCGIYKKFMTETKPYFTTYITTCINPIYSGDSTTTTSEDDLKQMFTKAADNSTTECCKDNGNCNENELFELNNDKSNIRYKCFCPGGKYNSKRDSQQECKNLLKPSATVRGRTVEPQQLGTAGQSGGNPTTTTAPTSTNSIMKIAQQVLDGAKQQWKQRDTSSSLVGKLSQAKFGKNGGTKVDKDDPCKLDKSKHTNDWRTYNATDNSSGKHRGPCTGKGKKGITEEKKWDTNSEAKDGYKDVLFPPRRLDMCTSNLESLNTSNEGLKNKDKAIHSLLGDVLLAAKEEANQIINLYDQNGAKSGSQSGSPIDDATKCRAIKASFADLGDIIRGRDLWSGENNTDMTKLQGYLKEIFKRIHEKHDGIKGNTKYASDATSSPPYKNLRNDWWTANRDKVWAAMKCDNTITCGDDPPLDDYVPQVLRWIDEWSHTYCVQRKTLANKVVSACEKCVEASKKYHEKTNVDTTSGSTGGVPGKECEKSSDGECGECKTACEECKQACEKYTQFVEGKSGGATNNWRAQWNNMNTKYQELMDKAKKKLEEQSKKPQTNPSGTTTPCSDKKDGKDCVKSFYEYLYESGYSTLSSYISNMSQNTDCGDDKHVVATNMWLHIYSELVDFIYIMEIRKFHFYDNGFIFMGI
ncbi:erythrocyte membrane protein 1, PfEMP1, putative [Plasmodium gaboni]|uniref:Erythrocyte membrane protein 1, PfEMP1, putative n=1 Tax=Plasmodium gaboni TaxID=647221 RepID=A0ABY0KWC8_9APIC|nr:erythrocyte membrane protein 1, PfEMP1, putative [Plasmodium gaboni]